jgi:lincosamide nucleotidyltransferase A/C/D/E
MAMPADAVVAVVDALRGAGVDATIAGGWAVDALLGRMTREHDDLDLAVDADDVDRALEVLAGLGLGVIADERPGRLVLGDGVRSVDREPVGRGLRVPTGLDRCRWPHPWSRRALPDTRPPRHVPSRV